MKIVKDLDKSNYSKISDNHYSRNGELKLNNIISILKKKLLKTINCILFVFNIIKCKTIYNHRMFFSVFAVSMKFSDQIVTCFIYID